MSTAEKNAARAELDARETAERLRETSIALLDANQALAQIPLLEFRVQELWDARQWFAHRNDELRAENERLAATIRELERATGSDAAT